jgi:hypothetical protein
MNSVAELTLAFIDLAKAELALSRKWLFLLGVALCLVSGALLLLLCGLGLLLYALYLLLTQAVSMPAALLLTGLLSVAFAATLAWSAVHMVKR